ncbi:cytochrome c [Hydrogenivirga caldilitoris]|uniref:Cytochrome c n=1 Tax=Hydrogenivirga caldilitoris TaxID=246264 RepID=A0A497XT26_9AQUI|nr:cytochrome c [Hydrogenivirga caldilitoris]
MRAGIFVVGALLGVFLFSCEKKEEKAQKPVQEEKKEEVVKQAEQKAVPEKKEGAYAIADSKGCLACHDVQRKKVGPAYVDVARRYEGKEGAVEELVKSITKGSMGKWGSIPMTPQPVTEEEAKQLAEWILSLK